MFVEHTPTVFFVSAVDWGLVLLESDFFFGEDGGFEVFGAALGGGEDGGFGVFGAGVVSGTFCERLDRYFLVFL
jgi:hypothetical protein